MNTKTRKSFLLILIICLLSLTMIIAAGCNKNTDNSNSETQDPTPAPVSNCVVSFYMFTTDTQPTFTIEVPKKGKIDTSKVQTLTRSGYDFGGWYKDIKFLSQFNFNSEIPKDMSLYAKWIAQNTTIFYETFSAKCIIAPKQVKIGAKEELPIPEREQCTFEGWFLDADYTQPINIDGGKYYLSPTEETIVYAKWEVNCTHSYTTEPVPYKEATCTTDGEAACFCNICGEIKEETRTIIPALGHDWNETTYFDGGTYHYHKCNRCDEEKDQQSHSWIMTSDDENHWQECSVCHVHQENSTHAHTKVRDESKDVVSATCGQESITGYKCSECGHDMSEHHEGVPHTPDGQAHYDANGHWNICTKCGAVVNYHNHSLLEVTEEYVKSTCVVHGHRIYHCNCGYNYEEELPLEEHKFRKNNQGSEWVDTANSGSLTEAQQALLEDFDFKICEVCGKECDITEHNFDREKIYTYATCSQEGRKEITCRNCGIKKTIITPMTPHTHPSDESAITVVHEVTCTTDGEIEYECAKCHNHIHEVVEAAHDWETIRDATCTVNGLERCRRCHEEEIVIAHHTFNEDYSWDDDKHWRTCSTCGERTDEHAHDLDRTVYGTWSCDGTITVLYYCTTCGYKSSLTEITGPGHNWDDGVKTKDPSCIELGEITYTCQACGHTRIEYIPMIDHDYNDGSQTKAPTCTVDGVWTYVCNVCGHEKYEAIPAIGHDFENEGTITTEPGCTTTGIRTHTCNHGCGEILEEIVAALGHTYSSSSVTREPTCTEKGERTFICDRCGEPITEDIPALGHDWNAGVVTVEPGCLTTGTKVHTCNRCHDTYDETLEALGHDYVDTVTPPTCTEQGYTTHHCKRCHHEERDTYVAALGHNHVAIKVVHPTCKVQGYTIYECTRCGDTYNADFTPKTTHQYEGFACIYCGDAQINQYLSIFSEHGNSNSDTITIHNETEFILFLDYICSKYIATEKYVTFDSSYINPTSFNSTNFLKNLVAATKRKTINLDGDNIYYNYSNGVANFKCHYSESEYLSGYANKLIGWDEEDESSSIIQDYFFVTSPTRANDWDEFAYKSYDGTMSCTTSDQIIYALTNGLKPVVTANTEMDYLLIEAKKVLRQICNDNMSDVAKIAAIYKWLVAHVEKDETRNTQVATIYDKVFVSNYAESAFGLKYKYNKSGELTGATSHDDCRFATSMGVSKAFVLLTGLEGIRGIIVSGTKADVAYYWNKVLVDTNDDGLKEWYALDLYSAIKFYESNSLNKIMSMEQLMVSDSYVGLTSTNYADCTASTMYNYYANGEETNLFIETLAQMDALSDYITAHNSKTTTYKTITVFVTDMSFVGGYTQVSSKEAIINNTSGYIVTIAI